MEQIPNRWARTGIVGRLNVEWFELIQDPGAARVCLNWALEGKVLSGVVTPEDVRRRIEGAPDAVLGVLLGAAGRGDTLAARVVLQAMLGKVVRMAAGDPRGTVDDYVAALWSVIATYPLAARPRQVAANLALDTLKVVRTERSGVLREVPMGPAGLSRVVDQQSQTLPGLGTGAGSPLAAGGRDGAPLTAAGVIGSAQQQRLLDPATGALLLTVYADGLSGRAAAARHRTSPGALRTRCSRAVRMLSQHAGQLLDAA